jgi:hypothetical protein
VCDEGHCPKTRTNEPSDISRTAHLVVTRITKCAFCQRATELQSQRATEPQSHRATEERIGARADALDAAAGGAGRDAGDADDKRMMTEITLWQILSRLLKNAA